MTSTNTSEVGINLAGTNYWSTEYPFLNRVKDSGDWTIFYSDKTQALAQPPYLDGDNNLTKLPTNATSASFAFEFDPIANPTTDRYVLTYTGSAKINIGGATIISSQPGKIVFQMTKSTANSWTSLSATNVDHLANLAIVREDQVALYNSGEIFNPAFVSNIAHFSTLRFMDWGATNNSKVVNWADRAQVNDRSWSGFDGGVPLEAMVALSNEAHSDMWVNIPLNATDDYVRQAMTYIRDHLDPTLNVKLEFSNEVWNWAFQQSKDALAKGDQLWGTDTNHDGKIDHATEGVADGYLQYYGYRAAQVASIANQVFASGHAGQLVNVLSGRGGSNGLASITNGVAKAGVGSVSTLFEDLSVDGYFGNFGNGSDADRATVLQWAKSGAAGLDAAFAEIDKGGTLSSTTSVTSVIGKFATYSALADKYGLDLVAYEGGIALLASNFAAADQSTVIDFYQRLNNDPRMGQLYNKLLDGVSSLGTAEFEAFNDASTQTGNHGLWGALSSTYDSTSVRWDALTGYAGRTRVNGVTQARSSVHVAQLASDSSQGPATGTDGSDTLIGGAGNDTLDGGKGADKMSGGAGDDLYMVDSTGDRPIEKLNEGNDTVQTTLASYTLPDNIENLVYTGTGNFKGVANALDCSITGGAGNDSLYGAAGHDTLTGLAGNDTLNDGGGPARMVGGVGDDQYYVANSASVIVELAGEGTDSVGSSVSYSIVGTAVENMYAKGTAAIDLTGNELDNIINGNDAANTLDGGAGNDAIKGMGGNDTLKGGGGNDTIWGGDGDDILIGGAGRDVMRGEAGNDTFKFLAVGDTGKTVATADNVYDFAGGDVIDLSAIDAIKSTSANDAFKWIGTTGFTGHAGELHYEKATGGWAVMGDIDGDKAADFVIIVNTTAALTASNFIL